MRWIYHKACTGVTVYALTHNIPFSLACAVASVLPDAIESPPWFNRYLYRKQHRQLSHYFMPYLIGLFIATFFIMKSPCITLTPYTIKSILAYQDYSSILCIGWWVLAISCIGALFHIVEDGLCGTVPGLLPFGKRWGIVLFKVRTAAETYYVLMYCMLMILIGKIFS